MYGKVECNEVFIYSPNTRNAEINKLQVVKVYFSVSCEASVVFPTNKD